MHTPLHACDEYSVKFLSGIRGFFRNLRSYLHRRCVHVMIVQLRFCLGSLDSSAIAGRIYTALRCLPVMSTNLRAFVLSTLQNVQMEFDAEKWFPSN